MEKTTRRDAAAEKRERFCHLWGWILFILCAVLFIASGVINRDALTTVGSAFFLIACFLFLIPLVKNKNL